MQAVPIRLLYIDDDAGVARLVQKEFERHGYAVEIASSGEEGLARLRSDAIDVIALDHYMPGCDGLATLAAIQAQPEPPPVIYVTGSEEGRVAIAALKAGAADYVIKDVSGEFLPFLRAAIESALAQLQLRREKKAAEEQVRVARDRFEALAAERSILLSEVNHRVSNSLALVASFLNMQADASDDPDVKAALATAYGRVLAVAQVHRRLYTSSDVRSVSLDQYLRALIADIDASSAGTHGLLSLAADPVTIGPDRAIAVGVIVTELILNALKHAYPSASGPVRVSLRKLPGGGTRLCVEDEGVGPAEASTSPALPGMGHIIIEAMVDKLGATISHDTASSGTRVAVDFR